MSELAIVSEKATLGDLVVQKLDVALVALGDAKTAQATKKVVDAVAALQTYARRQKLSEEVKQRGFAIWLEAMAQLGRHLKSEPMARGIELVGRDSFGNTKMVSPIIEVPTLAERNISLKESALAQKIAALPAETQSMIMEGATKLNAAFRSIEEDKRKEDLQRPVTVNIPEGISHGDFRILSKAIPDNSIELIFTDPPYDKDSAGLYEDAAQIAARILKPGGSFVAYSGQKYLPEVLSGCSKHLRYWWMAACVHAGGNQILQKLGVRCGWKPIIWFVKETRGDVKNIVLDTISGAREKESHAWQQAESEAAYFIEKLTSNTGSVVDFFLGGGTTAIVARSLGRNFIGYEVDASAIEKSVARLDAA